MGASYNLVLPNFVLLSVPTIDYCQSLKHKILKSIDGDGNADNKGKSTATDQRYFIGIGILRGGIMKVADQFEHERLVSSCNFEFFEVETPGTDSTVGSSLGKSENGRHDTNSLLI
jgi:hypothetical protein